MQTILVKVAFRSDEKMHEGSAEMFTELNEVINLDFRWELGILWEIVVNIFRTTCPTQPSWEVAGVLDQKEAS